MNEFESSPESAHHQTLEQLAAALGFVESSELRDLRVAISLGYSTNREQAIELKAMYLDAAQAIIDHLKLDPNQRTDAQIGLILMCASMKYHPDMTDEYNSELDQAYECAWHSGDNELAEQIDSMRIQ